MALAACMLLLASACSGQAGLADGLYSTTVDTDSSMFRVEKCELRVEGGQITATVTLPGQGYSRIYVGTADQAASAPDAEISDFAVGADGKYTFELAVQGLEEEMQVAAYGHRRDTWYDHTMIFHEPQGPAQDAQDSAAAGAPAELEAGAHELAVTLSGGSGKATVQSPAVVTVADDGSMTATITWSSPHYDQMVVDGVQYLPVNESGNSTFEIPVAALDEDLPVQAETTAMSEPHMIDYTLHFESASSK